MSDRLVICPPEAELKALLEGSLPDDQTHALSEHLENCIRCREALDRVAVGEGWPQEVAKNLSKPGGPKNGTAPIPVAERWKIPHPETPFVRDDLDRLEFLEPSDQPGVLGMLGPYEITETIGRGGFGLVLKGRDRRLNRIVAIKVLAPEWASNATARKRFLREAQAAAAVRHDHVVTIYAVDEVARLPYLVMEYIPGKSLQERLDETGPLEVRETLRIGRQIALGLAAAHAEGLIHRDIKPANILLEDGIQRVKITDFGLARAVDDVGMTQTGTVAGTPEYMSPEQAWGGVVDHRTDLFSLGGVLYAMCTGRSPFRAKSAMAVLKRVCEDEPRPIEDVNPEVPLSFVSIIEQLLAKDPDLRFASAQEVADLLGAQLSLLQNAETVVHLPIEAKPVPPTRPEQPQDTWSWLADRVLCANAWRPWRKSPHRQAPPLPHDSRRVRWGLMLKIALAMALIIPMVSVALYETMEKRHWQYLAPPMATSPPQIAQMQTTPPPMNLPHLWPPPLLETNELTLDVPNPKVQIAIDGRFYPVESGGIHRIRLGQGEHRIAVANADGSWFDQVDLTVPTSESYLRIDGGGILQSAAPTNIKVQWIPVDNYYGPIKFKGPDDVLVAPNYPGYGSPVLAWDTKLARDVPSIYSSVPVDSGMGGASMGGVQFMAVAPSGDYLALAGSDTHQVDLFDADNPISSNWLRQMTVTRQSENLKTLKFSPDSRLLFCAGQSRAELFRLDGLVATELGEIGNFPHATGLADIAKSLFLPDSQHILLADKTGNLELWKTQPLERESTFLNQDFGWGEIREMAADATGQRILLTCAGKLHLFDLKEAKSIFEFPWPEDKSQWLRNTAFLPDNRHVAFAVNGRTSWDDAALLIGDTQTGKITARLVFHEALRTTAKSVEFQDFRVSPDGRRITSICLVHSEVTQPNHAIAIVNWVVPEEAYSEKKSAGEPQGNGFELVESIDAPGKIASLAMTPDGGQFIMGSEQRTPAEIRGFPRGDSNHQLKPNGELPRDTGAQMRFASRVAVSPDGQKIAEAQGTILRLWNRETGESEFAIGLNDPAEFRGQTLNRVHAIRSLAWSKDGKHIVIACPKPEYRDGERTRTSNTAFAFLLEIEADKASIAGRYEHPGNVHAAIFLGDGQKIATACEDGLARIWERDATEPEQELRANGAALVSLDATADGSYLAAGSQDGTWHLWETRFGHRLNHWSGESAVMALKFLPKENSLVTGHEDGHVSLWKLSAPLEAARTPVNGPLTAMTTSADGRHLLTGVLSKDSNPSAAIHVWAIPSAEDQPATHENAEH